MILCESGFYFHVRLQAGSLWSAKRREGFHKPFTSPESLWYRALRRPWTGLLHWTPFLGSADTESAEHMLHSVVKMKGVCLLESFLVPEGGCWFSSSSLLLLQDKNSYPSHRKLTRPCPLILLCKDRWWFLSEKKV